MCAILRCLQNSAIYHKLDVNEHVIFVGVNMLTYSEYYIAVHLLGKQNLTLVLVAYFMCVPLWFNDSNEYAILE